MEKQKTNAAPDKRAAFFALLHHPLKFRFYLLKKVPAAFFSGVRIRSANAVSCTATVPCKRFTSNPFRSTYFACLSMAAELSTGALAMASVFGRTPQVSMLITGMDAKFYKKAVELTIFTCDDGAEIARAVAEAVATGRAMEVKAHSIGRNKSNEVVAEFWFTWSFKAR